MPLTRLFRDVTPPDEPAPRASNHGSAYIAVIGIDRYRAWSPLHNAVSDALGALALFERLGFEPACPPLLDEAATGDALRRLVTDDLTTLGPSDSLVVFFAGHGHTVTRTYAGRTRVKTGYLVPFDGDQPGERTGTWIRLDSWLSDAARLRVRHLLVFLDACHSGIALHPVTRWRSNAMLAGRPLDQLRVRRSRRIITSALDDQRAMDSGPVPGHSLFTGCLIEALTGGIIARTDDGLVTGTEIGGYIQRRVIEYPSSNQTPDFGALELDDRGELVIRISTAVRSQATFDPAAPSPAQRATSRAELADVELAGPPRHMLSPDTTHDGRESSASSFHGSTAVNGARTATAAITVIALLVTGGIVASHLAHDNELADPTASDAAPDLRRDALSEAPHHAPSEISPDRAVEPPALATTIAQRNPFLALGGLQVEDHQVTRGEYAVYLATLNAKLRAEAIPLDAWSEARPDEPVRWTRFEQATAFCAAIGARLPTFEEWQRASGGSWGLDPARSNHAGPLREWTSERTGNFVRVAGAMVTMSERQRTKALSETFQLATADAFPADAAVANDVSSEEVGIRCVK